jgi:hypothetical protein
VPADGRRKKILVAIRDALKNVSGADYFNDFSGSGVCELGRIVDPAMTSHAKPTVVRVFDGSERISINGANDYTAMLEVQVAVMIRDTTGTLVERMADAIADISLAIGRGSAGGGVCTTMRIGSVDSPEYDLETVYTTVRVATTYDFVAGVDR